MIYEFNLGAVIVFGVIVGLTLALSFYLGSRAKSASGFFAAGGGVHWFVNGIAFAGDYLSAASFLGICGMIAFYGYDGFLYSIGYLAGWVVALFVVAEPLKRMGKYTFADALDSRFQSRGLKLAAAISTLVVSVFYLIPQMVGAGVLVTPLFGLPHWAGVVIVGAVVILIVASAGMVSTTYVQFLKGSLLVFFSVILTFLILQRGVKQDDREEFAPGRPATEVKLRSRPGVVEVPPDGGWVGKPYLRFRGLSVTEPKAISVWRNDAASAEALSRLDRVEGAKRSSLANPLDGKSLYWRAQTVTKRDGTTLVNDVPQGKRAGEPDLAPVGHVVLAPNSPNSGIVKSIGLEAAPAGPLQFIDQIDRSVIALWESEKIKEADGSETTVYSPRVVSGGEVLRPGNLPAFRGIRGNKITDKVNFVSLMLALFCGTASLPHILIRYYTVKDQASARKSTIVGIGSIGFFYILTLFMGLGAMTSGAMDVTNSNMAAPLLARSFSQWLFAIISAIAFTTVLGTVSGLIIAASGAVVHDLMSSFLKIEMSDHSKVRMARWASVVVGAVAIVLGIVFKNMNVNYLVGWAFSIAASANLPALVMLLFWRGTTRQGITAAILVGMFSSLAWILLSADTFKDVYGLPPEKAIAPFSQPGIVTIPLGFVTLVVVSLLTRKRST